MSVQAKINDEIKKALKDKDNFRATVLRSLKTGLVNAAIEKGLGPQGALSDEDAIKVLKRALKQRKESAEQFKKGGRKELAEKEEKEVEIIKEFLPEEASDEEIEKIVKECMSEFNVSDKSAFSKIMPCAMQKLSGRADGSRVRKIVELKLN